MNTTALRVCCSNLVILHDLLCGALGTFWLLRRSGDLAVFFVKQLGFSQEQAFITFGAFRGAGLRADLDRRLRGRPSSGDQTYPGARRGCAGYRLLYDRDVAAETAADLYRPQPSPSATVCLKPTRRACCQNAIRQKDAVGGAFTLFYMSINIGSLLSLSLAPVIAEKFGYATVFFLARG